MIPSRPPRTDFSGPPYVGLCALAPEVVRAELGVERVTRKPLWYLTRDGDVTCLALYRRHYSCRNKQPKQGQFVGPGEQIVLRTDEGDAVFVWRRSRHRRDGQEGVECSLFRNEGPHQSSELIRQADAIADHCWPGRRHYTFVDAKEVRSSNPGYCFLAAGWRRRGRSAGGLLILERPDAEPPEQPVDHGADGFQAAGGWVIPPGHVVTFNMGERGALTGRTHAEMMEEGERNRRRFSLRRPRVKADGTITFVPDGAEG